MQFNKLYDAGRYAVRPMPSATRPAFGASSGLAVLQTIEPEAPKQVGVSFLERRVSQCAWPMWASGDVPIAERFVCGDPVQSISGRHYCTHHLAVSRKGSGAPVPNEPAPPPKIIKQIYLSPKPITLARSAADEVPVPKNVAAAVEATPVQRDETPSRFKAGAGLRGIDKKPRKPMGKIRPKVVVPTIDGTRYVAQTRGDTCSAFLLSQTSLLSGDLGIVIRLRDAATRVVNADDLKDLRATEHEFGSWSVVLDVRDADDVDALCSAIGKGFIHAALSRLERPTNTEAADAYLYWRIGDVRMISYQWLVETGTGILAASSIVVPNTSVANVEAMIA